MCLSSSKKVLTFDNYPLRISFQPISMTRVHFPFFIWSVFSSKNYQHFYRRVFMLLSFRILNPYSLSYIFNVKSIPICKIWRKRLMYVRKSLISLTVCHDKARISTFYHTKYIDIITSSERIMRSKIFLIMYVIQCNSNCLISSMVVIHQLNIRFWSMYVFVCVFTRVWVCVYICMCECIWKYVCVYEFV